MNRKTIVAANWKMNGNLALVKEMSQMLNQVELADNVEVIVCPSSPYLAALDVAINAERIHLGTQNVNEHDKGAFTGEVSTDMLKEMSVSHVILGHSERRAIYNETSTQVAKKVKKVIAAGLTPILCIGESETERESEQTEIVLAAQLQPVLDEVGIEAFNQIVVAYEPVWAIGTGKTASPEMAQATHQFIRAFLAQQDELVAEKVPLLYGGSVNAANSNELFAQTDIDGGLIGGASLKVDEFKTVCSTAKGFN